MKFIPLSPTDRSRLLATHKVILDFNDILALGASTTGTIAIYPRTGNAPAGTSAAFVKLDLITAFDFSDASINSLLIEVGDGGDTDRLHAQTELAIDGTEILFSSAAVTTQPYSYTVADTIDAKFTVAGGASPTLAEATSGEVHILLFITDTNDTERVGGPLS